MPLELRPLSRRRLLGTSLAALTAGLLPRRLWAADKPVDPARVALFSDTHVAADAKAVLREVCMFEHLQKASADMLAQPTLPSAMLVNGDLALNVGLPGDYATFTAGVKPIREAGVPIHLTLGNHDDRDNFWKAVPPADAGKVVDGKHVSVVTTRFADFLLLDSLELVNKTPGLLGDGQRAWLERALDARADRPCVVVVHHNPIDPNSAKPTGIKDTAELMKILLPRKQAKALVFGHTHKWVKSTVEGLHLLNLPPVAYVFKKGDPSGWVDCTVDPQGAKLMLRTIDPAHPAHRDTWDLKWRT